MGLDIMSIFDLIRDLMSCYDKSMKLNEKQQEFVNHIIDGLNQTKAAELCGYRHPTIKGSQLMALPHIKNAVMEGVLSALSTNLLPKSLRRLDDILDDMSAAPSAVKLKAAQFVIDKALELRAMQSAQDIANKDPMKMTEAELEIFIMRGTIVMKREKALKDLGIIDADAIEIT